MGNKCLGWVGSGYAALPPSPLILHVITGNKNTVPIFWDASRLPQEKGGAQGMQSWCPPELSRCQLGHPEIHPFNAGPREHLLTA